MKKPFPQYSDVSPSVSFLHSSPLSLQKLEDQTKGRQKCLLKRQPQGRSPPRTAQGFEKGKNKVLRLRKSLYGLKQSSRRWHSTLRRALAEKGVFKTNFDPSIFINKTGSIIIAAFVDDLGSVYSNEEEETELFQDLKTRFQMTGGEPIKWMVGINILFSPENIRLSQMAYLERVLERFGRKECRLVSTPLENQSLTTHPREAIETTEFPAVIGCLMYAAVGTRLDIAYAVTFLLQFSSHPGPDHWVAAKRVLRYIKGTFQHGHTYPRSDCSEAKIIGYADASYASNPKDRRSFLG